ncbi:MAG: sulfopyruvate decarboxylase subunit beta [Candidatus Methanoperedens sp.]|nr:sulfopyruvate decarboxylase subunit beta [Candidatus Methanoperedens sp.]
MQTPEQIVVDILKNNGVDIATTLPCDRIKALLPLIEKNIKTIPLTREENGIGICAGVSLGGGRPVMVIQSTGLGNMINALLSLNITYSIPLPIIASWRGVYKESIEAQWPFGKKLPAILEASGIKYTIIGSLDEIGKLDGAIKDSFANTYPHVILISPEVWEGSTCEVPQPLQICIRNFNLIFRGNICEPVMARYDAIKVIAENVADDIIIANLGVPSKELFIINDRALNFYMLGSMGLASSIGLGLSIIQEKHVFVIDGDGSLLMNPNAMISVGDLDPRNLTIIAIDNAAYGSTGNQGTCTLNHVDLELMAKGCGIADTVKVHTGDELRKALEKKAGFIHVIARPGNAKCKEIPLLAKEIRDRFMGALRERSV